MSCAWRSLTPQLEILSVAGVELLAMPVIEWLAAGANYRPTGEAQYAAVIEGATPGMVTALLLAERFELDCQAAALLIGWSTILLWFSLPLIMVVGLVP